MEKAKILVVEDEDDVRELMLLRLRREGYEAVGIENGEEAYQLFQNSVFHLAVLDWMLPGQSGLELCRKLAGHIPVLMVTARADTTDVVLGLEMGADDYITKPFEVSVFLARVRSLLRRTLMAKESDPAKLKIGELEIHTQSYELFCKSEEIKLTASEFKLLVALVKNQGRVLSRQKLIELVQGEGIMVIDRAIDTHIFGLRKKLGECSDLVETIRGIGYRIKAS